MKPLPRLLLTSLLFAAAGSAMAASSVDLTVTGLITPSACEPTLSGGGSVDYGKIAAKDLTVDDMTQLEIRNVAFNITCEAATLVALQGNDNRAGSDYMNNGRLYGLGFVNGTERLGDLSLSLKNLVADGATPRSIRSNNNGTTWTTSIYMAPPWMMSVADGTTVAPIPVTVLTGDLELNTWIAPTNELTLGSELPIDGSVTLQVIYL
ncbi:DUF1120 domain-containing protein [Pseudomonas costantinii]|uniref:DUF1120 domain-containing protein n=1 Tax=Pseudomonas costantinii TaxID=168469 RepID=UPI0015A18556|nr:DUF1120 domain-containing protein [Pseudomonas costantinii]NVZ68979.1 DUF1120 domain-containing protein [Pseudomonas costantinii]